MEGNRSVILRQQREQALLKYSIDKEHRVKWLIALSDIDDKLEELMHKNEKKEKTTGAGRQVKLKTSF